MLDLILKLIEQITKLVAIGEENHREYFDRYVQPTFQTAEAIYKDYRGMLKELRDLVTTDASISDLNAFLMKRREELLPARDRLRVLIERRVQEGKGSRFEAGILGLMTGAVTSVTGYGLETINYEARDGSIQLRRQGHTAFDLIRRLARGGLASTIIIDNTLAVLEEAWQNVLQGYADLQAKTLPGTKPRKKH